MSQQWSKSVLHGKRMIKFFVGEQQEAEEVGMAERLSFLPVLDLGTTTDLDKWLIFSNLDRAFVSKLRLACVFGSSGNEALVVTQDDDVFALGSNLSGCLGRGDTHGILEPRKVDALCRKGLHTLAYGSGPHVLAVTESGDLLSWGHNGYCQLGNNCNTQGLVPSSISAGLSHRVAQVACGSHHSLALTTNGDVYAWGQNNCGQVGSGSTTNQPTPRKVSSGIGGRRCIGVACGQTSSMAVMENGEVFGWGYNGNGQLGLGNNVNQTSPCRVTNLQGVVIHKVVCGYAHTMALSDEGVLYTWGANSYGQLGTGNKANQVSPFKMPNDIGRIVEIAASHYNHISAVMTQTSRVYMWGQCRGQSVTVPTETPFHSIHDVFACFACPTVTWKPMVLDICNPNTVANSVKAAFNDPTTSDLKICVEGRIIHVHKAVLKIRCEHFRSMFQAPWDEDEKDTIDVTTFPYAVYKAFLQYLYTDEVDLPPEDAIGLLDLANSYCEAQLKRHCERIIMHGVLVENVAMLYAAAIKFEAKDLEEFCFRFAMNHLTAVVQTDAFHKLEESAVKSFITKAAVYGAFKY
ncbi:RCC1 and BTB domain-containing protein 1-like isoform X1 [Rhipicephalus microplus]|uniref:RCC1 and BTB domain-containing protein 1-like isoform X1 n=2 Tax=Rhipicephalus microplus TaxID=6941 RepID=UPI003F6AA451